MTPEQRALVVETRDRLLCLREVDDEKIAALCDLADEQAAQIATLREAMAVVRSLYDHMSKLYDESKVRIKELEVHEASAIADHWEGLGL